MKGPELVRRALAGGYPVCYIHTWEEGRVERTLATTAQKFFESPVPFFVWSCVDGLSAGEERFAGTEDPLKALDLIVSSKEAGVYLLKDLPALLDARPELVRRLRDCYRRLKGKGKFIFLSSPRLILPEDLKREIYVIDFDLPDEGEIAFLVAHFGRHYFPEKGMTEEQVFRVASGLKGLTLDECEHVLMKVLGRRRQYEEAAYDEILSEKEQASKKEGVLEFVPPRFTLEDIGGLENLKDWLLKRRHLFTRQAAEAGLPVPKGILMMGMSGCGKSLSVKAISALWNLPLFRLDMNLIFGTENPEYTFHRALRTTEILAPVLLWIDEIEMAITGGREAGGGDPSLGRIFSTFLTWMQEKNALVFVAATANRIHLLPAEFIRKGRFDQVFFIDLPNEVERKSIFAVHLKKQKVDLNKFDVVFLAKATKGFNGAEIESVVQAAAVEAFNEKRPLAEEDITRQMTYTVPLSKTMEDQIKAIKSWAHDRALSASKAIG
ncbi:MAG: ATP-dependent zinc metalloprotease FtsH [Thermoanaerobaculia bacterium]|nr:ATP-dependent zinc metalloprotease FtsH [Thermoanaerobaculia bacterium]